MLVSVQAMSWLDALPISISCLETDFSALFDTIKSFMLTLCHARVYVKSFGQDPYKLPPPNKTQSPCRGHTSSESIWIPDKDHILYIIFIFNQRKRIHFWRFCPVVLFLCRFGSKYGIYFHFFTFQMWSTTSKSSSKLSLLFWKRRLPLSSFPTFIFLFGSLDLPIFLSLLPLFFLLEVQRIPRVVRSSKSTNLSGTYMA